MWSPARETGGAGRAARHRVRGNESPGRGAVTKSRRKIVSERKLCAQTDCVVSWLSPYELTLDQWSLASRAQSATVNSALPALDHLAMNASVAMRNAVLVVVSAVPSDLEEQIAVASREFGTLVKCARRRAIRRACCHQA